jgi:hypothetical protein
MVSTWKYTIFLALVLPAIPVIYAHAPPNLEDMEKPRWLSEIGGFVKNSLAPAKREASVSAIDPVAAANVDEDLDYRIAQRMKSTEGWRAFLTAHPDGPHAPSAQAELDHLLSPQRPPAAVAAEALVARSADAKTSADAGASPPGPSGARSEVATAADEICQQDEDRLERLSNNLTDDGVIRFLIELRCERLRPELVRLADLVDKNAPTTAAGAAQGAPSSVLPGPIVSAPPLPPSPPLRMRASEPQNRMHSTSASHAAEPKRHANGWRASNLPQLLLALFGGGPKKSNETRRSRAGGGSSGGGR